MVSFGSASVGTTAEQLPHLHWWVGKMSSGGIKLIVTLMLYGEAALVVTCRHLLSELG
jgi:hypothetical protein